jgi:uroporphyrinogen-III synthase
VPAMRPLEGRRLALLEARKPQELGELVARLGGAWTCAPAVREVAVGDDIRPLLSAIIEGRYRIAVLLTAVAFTTLCDEAERHGQLPDLREAFRRMVIASRGPKPQVALRKQSLSANVISRSPHTSAELLEALAASTPLDGSSVLLLHYGERNDSLSADLRDRGAAVADVCLYEWQLPEDVAPVEAMVRSLLKLDFDALLFTSQIQCRHLLQIARGMGAEDELKQVLVADVVVGAIGPVCAIALRAAGLVADVIPDLPNSSSLVRSVAEYFALTSGSPEEFP